MTGWAMRLVGEDSRAEVVLEDAKRYQRGEDPAIPEGCSGSAKGGRGPIPARPSGRE